MGEMVRGTIVDSEYGQGRKRLRGWFCGIGGGQRFLPFEKMRG